MVAAAARGPLGGGYVCWEQLQEMAGLLPRAQAALPTCAWASGWWRWAARCTCRTASPPASSGATRARRRCAYMRLLRAPWRARSASLLPTHSPPASPSCCFLPIPLLPRVCCSCVDRKAVELGLAGARTDYIQTDAAINKVTRWRGLGVKHSGGSVGQWVSGGTCRAVHRCAGAGCGSSIPPPPALLFVLTGAAGVCMLAGV